jgi:mono/diheme cytochrome c family protein
MKTCFFFLCVLFPTLALAGQGLNREEASRDAKAKFLNLNFFSNGRGMIASPGLITHFNQVMDKLPSPEDRRMDLRRWFTRRWGLNFEGKHIVGLFDQDFGRLRVGSVGCVACHSGRAAGQLVVGLGNKNIDVVRMSKDLNRLERWWEALVPASKKSAEYSDVEAAALDFSRYLSNEEIGNLTQGLVPVSFVMGWFYRIHGERIPAEMRRGQVKVPHLWGYEEKRKTALFSDGFGDPSEVGWGVLVELAAGQSPSEVRSYYRKIQVAEELFNHFLPPKYPFAVNSRLAAKGKAVFSRTCANCHGSYGRAPDGHAVFQQPKFIPWAVVRTDPDRTLVANDELRAQISRSPLADVVKATRLGHGYFAPRLEGVWARFPYLHNGSVPNIEALLTPPDQRPRVFSLKDAGERKRFDEASLGLSLPRNRIEEQVLLAKAKMKSRSVYFTEREGHSSQGHDFYTGMPWGDKQAVIEYLKTL